MSCGHLCERFSYFVVSHAMLQQAFQTCTCIAHVWLHYLCRKYCVPATHLGNNWGSVTSLGVILEIPCTYCSVLCNSLMSVHLPRLPERVVKGRLC